MKLVNTIIFLIFLNSCSTKKDRSIEEALSYSWRYTGQREACNQDDFIQLEIGGKYTYNVSINKCDFDEQNIEGKWFFNKEDNILYLNYINKRGTDTSEIYKLELLTFSTLILKNDSLKLEYKKI